MTKSKPPGGQALTQEQRHVLDYIGEISLELSTLAGRVGFAGLSRDLLAVSSAARATQTGESAGADQAET